MANLLKPEYRAANSPLELEPDALQEYRRFRFKTPAPSASDKYQSTQAVRVGASGTTLHIHKINGPGIIQIKLGAVNSNPWIDVAEGMTIRRNFTEFHIRDTYDYSAGLIHLSEVIIYTCVGEFITMPYKTHGFKPTPYVGNGTLTAPIVGAAGWVTLENFINGGTGALQEFAGDLTGAAFLLRCSQDSATGFSLRYGVLPVPVWASGVGYKVFPGEWVSIEVDSKIGRMSGDVNSTTSRWAWQLSGLEVLKTSNVNYIIGTRKDLSDIDYGSDPDIQLARVLEMG